ncbi:MAG: argininosuccinate synthase, partial [Candidatus Bathyarchaeia archaeon]
DHVEDRIIGVKSRESYECPAAVCLIEAHQDLEKLVLTPRELRFKCAVDEEWASLVYQGLWTDPLRKDLDAFIDRVEERVTGTVKMRLFKGSCHVLSRASPYSLYDYDLATYEAKSTCNQS